MLRGGAVFTADADNPAANAVAVRGGRIVYVGDDEGVGRFVGATTRTIEIAGGLVLPGFHDSHVHIVAGGLGLASCDLSGDDTAEAVATHIAACARDNPSSAWVTGRGWQLGVFPECAPDARAARRDRAGSARVLHGRRWALGLGEFARVGRRRDDGGDAGSAGRPHRA